MKNIKVDKGKDDCLTSGTEIPSNNTRHVSNELRFETGSQIQLKRATGRKNETEILAGITSGLNRKYDFPVFVNY